MLHIFTFILIIRMGDLAEKAPSLLSFFRACTLSCIAHVLNRLLSLQLERASDGFSVVAEYYGRGVFNKVGVKKCLVII